MPKRCAERTMISMGGTWRLAFDVPRGVFGKILYLDLWPVCAPLQYTMKRVTQGHFLQGLVNIQLDLMDWSNDWVNRLGERKDSDRNYQDCTRVRVSLLCRLPQVLKHFRSDKNLFEINLSVI